MTKQIRLTDLLLQSKIVIISKQTKMQNGINQAYKEYYRLFNQGVRLFQLQKNQQALKQFQYSLEEVPMGCASYLNLSVLYLKMKNYQQALKNCHFAIILRPYEGTAYYNRCMINLQNKKLIKANSDIQCALSCQYLKKYQKTIEIEDLNTALKFCPNNLQALKLRIIYKKLLQKSVHIIQDSSVFKSSQELTEQDQKRYKNYQKSYKLSTISMQLQQKEKRIKKRQQPLLNIKQQTPFFQLQSNYENQNNLNKNQNQLLSQLKQKILTFLSLTKGKDNQIQKINKRKTAKSQKKSTLIINSDKLFPQTNKNKQIITLINNQNNCLIKSKEEIKKNIKKKSQNNKENININAQNKSNFLVKGSLNKENSISKLFEKQKKSSRFIKNKECIFEDSNISICDYHLQTENQKSSQNMTKQLKIKNCPLISSISSIVNEQGCGIQNSMSCCNDMFLSLTKDYHHKNQDNMARSTISLCKNYTPQKITDRTFLNISNSLHKISCPKCTVDLQKQEQKNLKIQIYLTQIYHFQESFSTLLPYCLIIYKDQVFKTQVSKTTFPSWKDQIFISYQAEFQDNKQCNSQKSLRIQLWNKQKHGQDKIIGSADCQMKHGKRKVILSHRGRQSAYMYINSIKI